MTKLDPAHVEAWTAAMLNLPPQIKPEETSGFAVAGAFQYASSENGIGIRFGALDGRVADVYLNPVLARSLASHLLKIGMAEGWMHPNGDLNI